MTVPVAAEVLVAAVYPVLVPVTLNVQRLAHLCRRQLERGGGGAGDGDAVGLPLVLQCDP
jgi:hypothetical protein